MSHSRLTRREQLELACAGLRGLTAGATTALITWLLNLTAHHL